MSVKTFWSPIRILMQIDIKKILKKDIDNLPPETRRELKKYLIQ